MPIQDYSGKTFVAFTDISGFKEMMKHEIRAARALDCLYTIGYEVLSDENAVNGLFVSDCGVLFVRDHTGGRLQSLERLLRTIRELNRRLLAVDVMLTTSIAFGQFSYHQRLEFDGIEKNPIYGYAYVSAFLDNQIGKPKIQPGQCRIVAKGIDNLDLARIERVIRRRKHWHFYWMVDNVDHIADFEKEYNDAYQLKYRGMLEALKRRGQ